MKTPQRIAFILGTFPVVSQTFIVNQINGLIDEGLDIHLYAFKKGDVDTLHYSFSKHQLLDKVTYIKRMNSNYLVLGYFGFVTNQLDGQTVKTRNITVALIYIVIYLPQNIYLLLSKKAFHQHHLYIVLPAHTI